MSNIVTTLRNKDIVEYIGGLELGSSGIWRCACPIHKGNNESSFAVFPSHSFYCFSCGAHGQDIISYVMQRDGIPFDVAVRQLADEYGLVIDSDDGYVQQKDLADRNKIWARSMMKSVDAVRNYLHTRGFNDEAIKKYCFGWSSKQHCLSIPFFDTYSRCVGFCYRFFEGKSKYKNSKNNELFEKGSFLYNEHIAMKMIHKTKTLYLVEGCFDSCSGVEQGLATVAYCGITLGKAHVQEIKRMFSTIKGAKVICVPDADGKANKFVSRARVLFKELFPECVVKVAEINPEQGKDFNDLFAKGINIEEAITLKGIDLYCAEQVLLESKDKEVQEKLIVDFMRTISNPISKQDIATMLSEVWDRDVGLVRQLLDVKENTIDEKLLDIYSVSSAYESLDKMEEGEQIKTGWFNIDEAISMIKTDVCLLGAYSFAGKCVSKGTLISTSSGIVPIEDIKQGDEVVTLNESTGKLEFDKVSKLINSGIKKGYKVTTRTGQIVTVSKEHPFLTPNGWMRIEDGLSVGGQIGLPSYIPQKTTKTIPDRDVILLALLIADGSCIDGIRYDKDNDTMNELFSKVCSSFGTTCNKDKGKRTGLRVVKPFESGIISLLKKYGLYKKHSYEKEIPDIIFQLSKKQKQRFIELLWSGDGTTGKNGKDFEYCSTSEKLCKQLQTLLLEFGIISVIKSKIPKINGKKYRIAYRLSIPRNYQKIFYDNFNIIKNYPCNYLNNSKKHERYGRIRLDNEHGNGVLSHYHNRHKDINHLLNRFYNPKTRCGAIALRHFCNIGFLKRELQKIYQDCHATELGYAIMEDVFFDEIVAIEEIEDVQMYDIAMPKNHNFVANNIILHNTSCLCQMILDWTIVQQKRVLFFSLEMPKQRVMQTLVAMICQIPRHKVLGYIHEHPETAQLIEEKLADRLHIIDRNDITIDGVEDYLRLVNVHKGQVDIVCVDYFGYLQGTDDVEGQESTAKKMKAIAKRNNILFVMLTQFNKASQLKDGTKFHEPTMNDIKGAGGQGASADTILLLWKADSDTSLSPIDREKLRNISYIKIGKCRESKNGNTLFQMKYNPETSLVEEYIGENFLKGR